MNTIQCWITREPKGEYEDDYMLHFKQPELDRGNSSSAAFWSSNDDAVNLAPAESYGLNYGECKEWVMVKKEQVTATDKNTEILSQSNLDLQIENSHLRARIDELQNAIDENKRWEL